MGKINRIGVVVLAGLLLGVAIGACAAKPPEERVAEMRGRYTARLNGFIVQEAVAVLEEEPAGDMDGEAEAEATAEPVVEPAEGEDGEVEELEELPGPKNVLLDIIVQHDNPKPLAGVTVDISMVDGSQAEVGSWRIWLDTASLRKANQLQASHVLEDIEYEEGYGFSAEIRHPVPASERGDYREFSLGPP